jgi:two-component system cell cycle sensor histidine kinase/response regulator CckA
MPSGKQEKTGASTPTQTELLAKLNEAQQLARIGSWDWDLVSNVSWLSDETYRILGVTPEEQSLDFKENAKFIHPDDRNTFIKNNEHCLKTGNPVDCNIRICAKGGQVKWCNVQGKVIFSETGNPIRLIGTIQDITEHKRNEGVQKDLEARLLQSQKMESVGCLAGGIAHDFSNLLSVILGHTELLLEEQVIPTNSNSYHSLLEIQSAGSQAQSLIHQLLAFSRKQVLELSRLDLNNVIADFEDMLARLIGENIILTTSLGQSPTEIEADKSQIQQIILNLAINARNAMPHGGRLTLSCANIRVAGGLSPHEAEVPQGEYVELIVKDTGCGMSPEVMRRIFEPFFKNKDPGQGPGLGLSTVYGIVKQHKGYIKVESSVGTGTVFRLLFPRAPASSTLGSQPTSPALEQERGRGERILVMEDDPSVRKLTVQLLVNLGYTVIAAEGLEDMIKAATDNAPLDLLLIDVIMPQHSGKEVYETLAKLQPGLQVLFISGHLDNVLSEQGVLEPDTHLLRKPFSADSLSRKIREALRG